MPPEVRAAVAELARECGPDETVVVFETCGPLAEDWGPRERALCSRFGVPVETFGGGPPRLAPRLSLALVRLVQAAHWAVWASGRVRFRALRRVSPWPVGELVSCLDHAGAPHAVHLAPEVLGQPP